LVPHIDDKEEFVAPFYVTLNIHDKMLHNCMLDSGASHNLMPKVVMEKLGLEITRPYHDLYSFDARKVKCDGLIKDMVVTLAQLPVKSIMMDVVVVDVPANYGMFLSRTWERKLGGTMQMDMTYATVPVFGGENMRLYRETKFSYVVSDHKNPVNHPIYVVDEDIGCCILTVNEEYKESPTLTTPPIIPTEEIGGMWKMHFDGAYSKEGVGVGVVLISPSKKEIHFSYKMEFEATNNVAEYEALILGLKATRKMQITELVVFGDLTCGATNQRLLSDKESQDEGIQKSGMGFN
jgi:hypothetical protein